MKHILKQFTQREAHVFIQFIKYGICGCLAFATDVIIFYALAWKLIPALTPDDIVVKLLGLTVEDISVQTQSLNFVINKSIAFILANFVAYLTNFYWVFTPGRHDRHKEIILFYVVSIASWLLGTFAGWLLIVQFECSTTAAYAANVVASVLINFAGRKYLVFHG